MFRFVLLATLAFVPAAGAQTVLIDFEELPFASVNYTNPDPALNGQSFMNGQTLNALTPPATTFVSGGATFNTSLFIDNTYGPISGGWAYSNIYNPTSFTFTEPNIAYNLHPSAGVGANGAPTNVAATSAVYLVAENYYRGESTITLPAGHRPISIDVTNTTYAAYTMANVDPNGYSRKFGVADPEKGADGKDWFKLTIIGKNTADADPTHTTGKTCVLLADFTSSNPADHYILDHWKTVDLSAFGSDTNQLVFELSSTDNGEFGMNTPAYFAMDNVVFAPVPEPGSILAIAAGAGLLIRLRKCVRVSY